MQLRDPGSNPDPNRKKKDTFLLSFKKMPWRTEFHSHSGYTSASIIIKHEKAFETQLWNCDINYKEIPLGLNFYYWQDKLTIYVYNKKKLQVRMTLKYSRKNTYNEWSGLYYLIK